MKKLFAAVCTVMSVATWSHIAAADDFATGIKVSTLGPGIEIQKRLSDNLGLRLGVNYLPISTNFTADDVRYKADFSWKNASLLADFYPFSGTFRLTGGLFYNGNTVDVSATPRGDVRIGNNTYTSSEVGTITGSVEFKNLVPYAGLGWSVGRGSSSDWSAGFDLGVMFQGAPSVSRLSASGSLASDSAFTTNLEKQRADIKSEMESYQYYPVVAFTLAYHF